MQHILVRYPVLTFLLCILTGIFAGFCQAASVTLAWDANTESTLAGYKLYYGLSSRTYSAPINVGKVTEYKLDNVEEGKTIYFAVTAYDINGLESDFSAELQCFSLVPGKIQHGTITPDKTVWVSSGNSQTFTIAPQSGYVIQDVLVNNQSVGQVSSYTFANVSSNGTISASFKSEKSKSSETSDTSASESVPTTLQMSLNPNIMLGSSAQNDNRVSTQKSSPDNGISTENLPETHADAGNDPHDAVTRILAGSGYNPGFGGSIAVLTPSGETKSPILVVNWPEYQALNGEIRPATGDIDGDGKDEIVVGLAPILGMPAVPGGFFEVLDDDRTSLGWGQVNWPEYNQMNGETRPAIGDLDGDGKAEIIIGLGPGGNGLVEVFGYVDKQVQHLGWLSSGWEDYNRNNGETRPACGDLNADGKDEIVAGLGPIPEIESCPDGMYFIFGLYQSQDNEFLARQVDGSDAIAWGQIDWMEYNQVNGECWPAVGDLDADQHHEIVLGLGIEGKGRFGIVSFDIETNHSRQLAWKQSAWKDFQNDGVEIRPTCGNMDADSADEIVLGFGAKSQGFVELFDDALTKYQSIRQIPYIQEPISGREAESWPSIFHSGQ